MVRNGILLALAVSLWISAPLTAEAAMWDWVPKMFSLENPYKGPESLLQARTECRVRNAWGRCIVFTFTAAETVKMPYKITSSFDTGTMDTPQETHAE